jgi:hypothetical protein
LHFPVADCDPSNEENSSRHISPAITAAGTSGDIATC